MARAKKTTEAKHDAHVAAYIADALAAPAPLANVTLAQALAESGETMQDLQEKVPGSTKAKAARNTKVDTGAMLCLSEEMLAKVRQGNTRQGAGLNLGKDWYRKGIMAPSIRHAALEAICSVADEEGMFSMADAIAALEPLKASGALGCSTPVSRVTKFIRSGHIVEA